MAKRGRPFAYESDAEKPVTVSLRIPRDVYEQAKRYVGMRHPMTLTDLLLDGLRLRLDTPADPRDIILSDYNTVIQELQEMIQAAVQAEIGKLRHIMRPHFSTPGVIPTPYAPTEPVLELSHYYNTVLQEVREQEQEATDSRSVHDDKDLSQGDTECTRELVTATVNGGVTDTEPPTRRGVPK